MRTCQIPLVSLLLCTLLLVGCGQTGPLYLPEPEQEQPRETEAGPAPDT